MKKMKKMKELANRAFHTIVQAFGLLNFKVQVFLSMCLFSFKAVAQDYQLKPKTGNISQDAQSAASAFNDAASGIVAYIPYIQNICYAIAAVVAVAGAISIYIKMNNEEQDVKKSIMMVIGACIFLIAAAQALPLFFVQSGGN